MCKTVGSNLYGYRNIRWFHPVRSSKFYSYALLFLLWDTPLLFDLVKLKSGNPGRYTLRVSMKHPWVCSVDFHPAILCDAAPTLKVDRALRTSEHVRNERVPITVFLFLCLPPLALHPLCISPSAHVWKAELLAEPAGCGSLLNHSHGTG